MPIDFNKLNELQVKHDKENGVDRSPINAYSRLNELNTSSIVNSVITRPIPEEFTKEDYDNYVKYGVYPGLYDDRSLLDKERAKNQSWGEQLFRTVEQIVVPEVILGTFKGISDLVDAAGHIRDKDNDYTNAVSTYLEDLQNKNKERFAIYQQNPGKSWDVSDFGWWGNNLVSVGSTLSLFLPSLGIAKGVGLVGKALHAEQGLNRLLNYASRIGRAGKAPLFRANLLTKEISNFANDGFMALLSRTAENYQEARSTYTNVKEQALQELAKLSDEERTDLYKRRPEYIGKSDEEIAEKLATTAGYQTKVQDYWMLLMDLVEYRTLGKMWRGESSAGKRFGAAAEAQRESRRLAGEVTDDAIKFKTKFLESLKYGVKNPIETGKLVAGALPFNEAIEEGFQGIVQARSEELIQMMLDPKYSARTISSYLTDPSILEQAFFGVIDGALFGLGAKPVKRLIHDRKQKKALIERGFTEEQANNIIKATGIEQWTKQLKKLSEDLDKINQGINITNEYRIDDRGNIERDENGVPVINRYESNDEIEEAKIRRINQYLTDVGIRAIDNGYYDMLEAFIQDPNFNKFMSDNGAPANSFDRELNEVMLEHLQNVKDKYTDTLNLFNNTIDSADFHTLKQAANNHTRKLLDLEALNDRIAAAQKEIDDIDDISTLPEDVKLARKLEVYKSAFEELNKEAEFYVELLAQGKISNAAFNQYIKDNDRLKSALIKRLNELNDENEYYKDIKHFIKQAIDSFTKGDEIRLYNDYIEDLIGYINSAISSATPVSSRQDVRKKLYNLYQLEVERDFVESNISRTKEEIINEYEEIYYGIDTFVTDRLNKVMDILNDYINKYATKDNIDNIEQELIDDDIRENDEKKKKEILRALEIAKLGHGNTYNFRMALKDYIANKKRELTERENNANTNEINGQRTQSNNNTNAAPTPEPSSPSTGNTNTNQQQTPQQTQPETQPEVQANEEVIEILQDEEEMTREDVVFVQDELNTQIMEPTITEDDLEAERRLACQNEVAGFLVNNFRQFEANIYNIRICDETDSNYVTVLNAIKDFARNQGFTEQEINKLVKEAFNRLVSLLNVVVNNNSSNASATTKDKLKAVIKSIKTKVDVVNNGNGSFSLTTMYNNEDLLFENIKNLLKLYAEERKLKENANGEIIIDIDDFFNYLLREGKEFDYYEKAEIFLTLKDFINNKRLVEIPGGYELEGKYKIKGVTKFNSYMRNADEYLNELANLNRTMEMLVKSMHTQAKKGKNARERANIEQALKLVREGKGRLVIEKHMYYDDSGYSLSIKYKDKNSNDGVEVAYLASVHTSNEGKVFWADKNKFVYKLSINEYGQITSNFDKLFNYVFDELNKGEKADEFAKILLTANTIRNETLREKYIEGNADKIVNNPIIRELLDKEDINLSKELDNIKLASAIIYNLNPIIFFNQKEGFDYYNALKYINQWKDRLYNNYVKTNEIQNKLANDEELEITLDSSTYQSLNYVPNNTTNTVNEESGFNERDENGKPKYNIVYAPDYTGVVYGEDGTSYGSSDANNVANFKPGMMGVLVHQRNGLPFVAQFTGSNPIAGTKVGNKISKEIEDAIFNYLNKENKTAHDVVVLKELLAHIIGEGTYSSKASPITYGLKVATNGVDSGLKTIYIYTTVNGEQKAIASIYSENSTLKKRRVRLIDKDGNTKSLTGLLDLTQPQEGINRQIARLLVTHITPHLKFNRSVYSFVKPNESVHEDKGKDKNPYFYTEVKEVNGKLIKRLYVMGDEYIDYLDYVSKNGAFNTNVKKNPLTNGFTKTINAGDNGLYINVASLGNTPQRKIARFISRQYSISRAVNLLKQSNNRNPVDKKQLFDNIFDNNELSKALFEEIVTANIYHVDGNQKYDAQYSNGKIYISNRGLAAIENDGFELLRLLSHESIHNAFAKLTKEQKEEAVKQLLETYRQFAKAVQNSTTNNDLFDWARRFIENNNFKPGEFKNAKGEVISNEKFAEEWLAESITRPELMEAMNQVVYSGKINTNEKKSILQRIIEILAKIFGINLDNINKNSILAKQYSIFNIGEAQSSTEIKTDVKINEETKEIELTARKEGDEQNASDNTNAENNESGQEEKTIVDDEYTYDDYDEDGPESPNDDSVGGFIFLDSITQAPQMAVNPVNDIEAIMDAFYRGEQLNNGYYIPVNNTDEFIAMFRPQYRATIAKMVANGEIKILCR